MAPSIALRCVVVTPERSLLDETVDFVALPMYDGELGVLPGRRALIGRLGAGELRLRRGPDVRRYYLDGGFTQIQDDVVTVLTSKAVKAAEIDVAAARRVLEDADKPAPTPEAQQQKLDDQHKARVQIRIAQKGAAPE